MCGIAGILGQPDRDAVQRMMAAMVRRGPDDSGLYADRHVALGHRRLSIIDLSKAAHQPMSRANGRLWIVYNGEVYNFASLRQDLESRGHRFESRSDTEVILAVYEQYGVEGISRLKGMFAFGIWDLRGPEPVLVLARDHFGIKPLVYAETPQGLIFASDLPTLMASGYVPGEIDRAALVQYLLHGHVVIPRTIIQGVSMLPAAHILTVSPGKAPRLHSYWKLDEEKCTALSKGESFKAQAERVRALLENAARSQMVSDVPLGAFLSGGVDSNAIVALMTRARGKPIRTFSIGFPDVDAIWDESDDAKQSAQFLGTIHHSVSVTGRDVAEALPQIAADLGQPSIDGTNMYFVSRAARTEVTVALAGVGGDEFFSGYPTFGVLGRYYGARTQARRAARVALNAAKRLIGRKESSIENAWRARKSSNGFAAHYMSCRMIREVDEAWALAGRPEIDPEAVFGYIDSDDASIREPIRHTTALEAKLYMGSQVLRDTDAASMASSLEVRLPLLDVDLAEYAFGLEPASKLRNGANGRSSDSKLVLIESVRDVIPDWTWRKPKRGFSMPFATWLRGPLRPLVEQTLHDREYREQGLIDLAIARRRWRNLLQSQDLHWSVVWSSLMLRLWGEYGFKSMARSSAGTREEPVPSAGVSRPR